MKKLVLVGLFGVLAAACANPSQQEKPQPPDTTVRLQSPVRVSWEEVSRGGTQAVVVAKVERLVKLDIDFLLSVELPAGVKAAEGRTQLQLLRNTEPVTITERYLLTYDAPPADDARLKLDGEAVQMGFHFNVPYRFGRPPPPEGGPAATGPEFKRGDKSLGPSIPLK